MGYKGGNNLEPIANLQAEQDILASILVDNNIIAEVISILEPSDFFAEKNRLLYQAMSSLYTQDKPIDITTLTERFGGNLDKIGGFTHIANLLSSGLPNFNIEHVKIIKEKSNKRKLQKSLAETLENMDKQDFKTLINSVQESAFLIDNPENAHYINDEELMTRTVQMIENNYKKGGGILGIQTKIGSLDKAINGLQKKKLYVIAARPGMGKSALALNINQRVSKEYNSLYYSLEMAEEELGLRRLAMTTLIDSERLERGNMKDSEWTSLIQKAGWIGNYKSVTNCRPGIHVNEITAQAKKLKLQNKLDCIIIDHLGLMDTKGMGDGIREQTTNICIRLKNIAKDLDIPVIVLSQLSRNCEMRANKRPMLADLKESGGVEENADVVMLLYRDEYYNKDTDQKNTIECNIAKQRGGRTGTIKLAWKPEYQLIADFSRE